MFLGKLKTGGVEFQIVLNFCYTKNNVVYSLDNYDFPQINEFNVMN